MKILFCILASILVFRPAFPYLEYVLNYDYIVNVLCINKDKPEMHCNGKCHLKKELTEASGKESASNKEKPVKRANFQQLFFEEEMTPTGVFLMEKSAKKTYFQSLPYVFQYHYSLFRPPIAV